MTSRVNPAEPDMWADPRLLSTAARLWEYALNSELKKLKLTLSGLVALQALHAAGTTSQAALARIIRVQPQTLRRTLRSLEAGGYLTNSAPTPGSRGLNISITSAGELALSEADGLEQRLHRILDSGDELHEALVMLIESLTVTPEQTRTLRSPVSGT
ncbi:MarR family winged helix-turn-helix transcriptional regulator [Arthrobacter sp. MDT1-48-3]